nr:PREDICTED: uncharacterized protein LOC109033971 [Bemisia tabaci]
MRLWLAFMILLCACAIVLAEDTTRTKRRLVHTSTDLDLASPDSSSQEAATPLDSTSAATPSPTPSQETSAGSSTAPRRRRKGSKGSNRRASKPGEEKPKRSQNSNQKKKIVSNSKLLSRLGLARVEPGPHYRKRLAGGAHAQRPEGYKGHQKRILENLDSRMYVIKLPPSSYYYASHHDDKFRGADPGHKSFNNLGINFASNGKPSKVYHYNIPVINKLVGRKTNSNFYKYDDDINDPLFLGHGAGESSVYNVKNIENHQYPSDLGHSTPAAPSIADQDKASHKKHGPKKTVTYMKPKPTKQFTKYFPSNGKPHAFYIIENSSKPYYHRLLP